MVKKIPKKTSIGTDSLIRSTARANRVRLVPRGRLERLGLRDRKVSADYKGFQDL
jgi:hypothetical protein